MTILDLFGEPVDVCYRFMLLRYKRKPEQVIAAGDSYPSVAAAIEAAELWMGIPLVFLETQQDLDDLVVKLCQDPRNIVLVYRDYDMVEAIADIGIFQGPHSLGD